MERKRQRKIEEFNLWLAESIATLKSPDEIAKWLLDGALQHTMDYITCKNDWRANCYKKFKVTSVRFTAMRYSELQSNSHNAPRGFKQNWCGNGDKDGIPKGYPGWGGNLHVTFDGEYPSFSLSSALTKLGVCTGSGGASQWGVTLFDEDWPAMKEWIKELKHRHEEEKILGRLKGHGTPSFRDYIRNAEYAHS